jgi:endo-1,3(4)-beta-glucanase
LSARSSCWLLLPLLGLSSCVVPGLELGPAQGGSGGGPAIAGDGGTGGGATAQAGTAGAPLEIRCEDFPITPKLTWMVAASSTSLGNGTATDPLYNPPSHAVDGNMNDRWASGQAQDGDAGQWFHIDFGATVALSEVTLEQGMNLDDFPRGYEISLSYRHTDFDAVASAKGVGAAVSESVIPLEERAIGRYMLIRQTGAAERWWSIAEINVACH